MQIHKEEKDGAVIQGELFLFFFPADNRFLEIKYTKKIFSFVKLL